MARSRHSNKEIEAALQYAELKGWRVVQSRRGHNWGRMYCSLASREGCQHPSIPLPEFPTTTRIACMKLLMLVNIENSAINKTPLPRCSRTWYAA